MQDRPAGWLEPAAAIALGCAVGFAVFSLLSWQWSTALAASALSGAGVSILALRILELVGAASHPLPDFHVEPIVEQPLAGGELFLRLRDVLAEASAAERESEALLLEDVLTLPAPDSRVVQLFQGAPMPTAGELQARIERHLDRPAGAGLAVDDSGELFEALASLKRSLG